MLLRSGLMKVMLEDSSTHQYFLGLTGSECNVSRQQLALTIKRLLLSRRNPDGTLLQITTVQTAVIILNGPCGSTFAASLLQADVAGKRFVFPEFCYLAECYV
jgi:hypothetical protein